MKDIKKSKDKKIISKHECWEQLPTKQLKEEPQEEKKENITTTLGYFRVMNTWEILIPSQRKKIQF